MQLVDMEPALADQRRLLSFLKKQSTPPSSNIAIPGTRLIREWQGQIHQVTVLESEYDYRGRCYKSLSAIARQITGTAWSGPLFFGLRK